MIHLFFISMTQREIVPSDSLLFNARGNYFLQLYLLINASNMAIRCLDLDANDNDSNTFLSHFIWMKVRNRFH